MAEIGASPTSPFVPPSRMARALRRWLIGIVAVPVILLLGLVIAYRFVQPVSTLMLVRMLGHHRVDRQWVSLAEISPSLQAAVIMSEDGQFCRHHGVDWRALAEVIGNMEHGERPRGASTLSMQTAKNLFLWPGRSYLRKALEIPLALLIDLAWGKHRLLEIYLNIAQWGPSTFGAEAAARRYFHIDASALTPRQATLLAAALPDPADRNAAKPGRLQNEISGILIQRLQESRSHLACLPVAQAAMPPRGD